MAETPMDIIMKHLSEEHDRITKSWNTPTEPSELAAAINAELDSKFHTISNEVIDAEEVTRTGFADRWLRAGSGPEEETCGIESNPNWLRNRAVNALALARRLEKQQGIRLPDNDEGKGFAADLEEGMRMPLVVEPPDGSVDISFRASGNPMLWYVGTDKVATRLDDNDFQPRFTGREAQIALALTDFSASRLHDITK